MRPSQRGAFAEKASAAQSGWKSRAGAANTGPTTCDAKREDAPMTAPNNTTIELEAELDKVLDEYAQLVEDFPDRTFDHSVEAIDAAVMRIYAEVPLDTLRGVQLFARALLTRDDYISYDRETLHRLLKALVGLPERRWDVRIA
jgi:hypothetical protein